MASDNQQRRIAVKAAQANGSPGPLTATLEAEPERRSEKPEPEDYLADEVSLIKGLFDAAEDIETDVQPITIERNGRAFFTFRVRPLSEKEFEQCEERTTTYERTRIGMRVPKQRDMATYRAMVIYTATVPEDKATLWDNRDVWARFRAVSGLQVVDKVLKAGEKVAVVGKIEEISGYNSDLEEHVGN
jgi:hypothetical protein